MGSPSQSALIRYCEELKDDKPELSKKAICEHFNYVRIDRHNLNFDMGETVGR
jgi:hypothetical protein